MKRNIWFALAALATTAAISYAGWKARCRYAENRAVRHREDMLDEAISETMDASDAVAKY